MASKQRHSLITFPPEISCHILRFLSSRDYVALSLVNKDFYAHFRQESLLRYAHRLYFPGSTEITGYGRGPSNCRENVTFIDGNEHRTGKDFLNALERTARWRKSLPTDLHIIEDIAEGTATTLNGILVDEDEGILVYKRDYGEIIIRDLNKPLRKGCQEETKIILAQVDGLSHCILSFDRRNTGCEIEALQMRISNGCLLLIGDMHTHASSRSDINAGTSHSTCAAFSLRPGTRGNLLCCWYEENTGFIVQHAHNTHYAMAEFDPEGQIALLGVVFPPSYTSPNDIPPGARFRIDTRRLNRHSPRLNTIAADEKGEVLYFGLIESSSRFPVVEVYAVPCLLPDGAYTPFECIKRVELRHEAAFVPPSPGMRPRLSSIVMFEPLPPFSAKQLPKDVQGIRFALIGNYKAVKGPSSDHFIRRISWDITSRPAPRKPSMPEQWLQGVKLADVTVPLADGTTPSSCFVDDNGQYDMHECYPRPTYFSTGTASHEEDMLLNPVPLYPDLDRMLESGRLIEIRLHLSEHIGHQKCTSICTMFHELIHEYDDQSFANRPVRPGVDDEDFIPEGSMYAAAYINKFAVGYSHSVEPDTITLLPEIRPFRLLRRSINYFLTRFADFNNKAFIPYPSDDGTDTHMGIDRSGDRRWVVYGSYSFSPSIGSKSEAIVIARFD